jgi:hypothetical protein
LGTQALFNSEARGTLAKASDPRAKLAIAAVEQRHRIPFAETHDILDVVRLLLRELDRNAAGER